MIAENLFFTESRVGFGKRDGKKAQGAAKSLIKWSRNMRCVERNRSAARRHAVANPDFLKNIEYRMDGLVLPSIAKN